MSEFYVSEKRKMIFYKQQIKTSLSRRLIVAVSVALLVSQTFLYSLGIPLMASGVHPESHSGLLPPAFELSQGGTNHGSGQPEGPVKHPSEGALPGAVTQSAIQPTALTNDINKGLLILVNKQHAVDKEYKPSDLTAIKYYAEDRSPSSRYMREEAAQAFNQMSEAAAQEGYTIVVTTAYRSYEFQTQLYNNYVNTYGQAAADTFSAQPGKSEHQTGLSADVSSPSVHYELTKKYIDTAEGKWLNDNAHKFGFIIRFPLGKEDITGYMYEPWHVRYVGKTAAEEIYTKGITLEEYWDSYLKTME
ncbi:M15 family metallopeptidase [Clostridium aminobutyricum]|uniref:M15 family metallopeptidase n=1 Tax=Clostridium aminobutyricum TaxID=33953 RepID=A0A939IH10_CLOAM|nr:M15 family metallopeptidase [Clostridium aminobutyricum]MBN7774310.1 M15 family metallopeptidase [Clostridium aminobutyricum]